MNRTRREDTQVDEDGPRQREFTLPQSSLVSTAANTRAQNPFAETQFTFQSPISLPQMGYQSPFGASEGGVDHDVTFEVIERDGNGRKRTVNHQLGSIWDVSGWGAGGSKRTRHA